MESQRTMRLEAVAFFVGELLRNSPPGCRATRPHQPNDRPGDLLLRHDPNVAEANRVAVILQMQRSRLRAFLQR